MKHSIMQADGEEMYPLWIMIAWHGYLNKGRGLAVASQVGEFNFGYIPVKDVVKTFKMFLDKKSAKEIRNKVAGYDPEYEIAYALFNPGYRVETAVTSSDHRIWKAYNVVAEDWPIENDPHVVKVVRVDGSFYTPSLGTFGELSVNLDDLGNPDNGNFFVTHRPSGR